jgi:hypothetical protein
MLFAPLLVAALVYPKVWPLPPKSISAERMAPQVVWVERKLALIGGYQYQGRTCPQDISWIEADGSERPAGLSLCVGRNHFRTVSLDRGRVLVLGGFNEKDGTLGSVECLDFPQKKSDPWPALQLPVELFTVHRFEDRAVIFGGLIAQGETATRSEVQWIDLRTGKTSLAKGGLIQSRFGHDSVWLPRLRKYLIVGGKKAERFTNAEGKRETRYTPLRSVELWDPFTEKATPAGELTEDRDRPALHLLPDGKVLVIGGENASRRLPTIELYDPATRNSQVMATMSAGRMATMVLPNHEIGLFLAGGWVNDPEAGKNIDYLDLGKMRCQVVGRVGHIRSEGAMVWLDGETVGLIGGKDWIGDRNPHSYAFRATERFRVVQFIPLRDHVGKPPAWQSRTSTTLAGGRSRSRSWPTSSCLIRSTIRPFTRGKSPRSLSRSTLVAPHAASPIRHSPSSCTFPTRATFPPLSSYTSTPPRSKPLSEQSLPR